MNIDANYAKFLKTKFSGYQPMGGGASQPLHHRLFPYQKTAVEKLLECGRGAAFLDTGMGKTSIQIEWIRQIDKPSLIVCPLAVADQTIAEAQQFGVEITKMGGSRFEITNYESMHKVDSSKYQAVVFDESSIFKSLNSKTKSIAEQMFAETPYKLACSATPSPNDLLEIGNQSQVLGVLRQVDMLSRWFVNDASNTGTWRLKGHARSDFWNWVNSWACVASSPADLGDLETDLSLPELREHESIVEETARAQGGLFAEIELSATGIRQSKKQSLSARVDRCADLVDTNDYALVWCDTNDESDLIAKKVGGVEVRGDMSIEEKESRLVGFSRGDFRVLVTKPSIAGFGMNWQHCNNVVFAGANYSFERYYQAVRRCWRFGQKREVDASVVMTPSERLIWMKTREKAEQHKMMSEEVRRWAA